MIRTATLDDMDQLLIIGKQMFDESKMSEIANMIPSDVVEWFTVFIEKPQAELFVAEHEGRIIGFLNCFMSSLDFDRGHTVAYEDKWYVVPEHRRGVHGIRLLDAFTKWADGKYAKSSVIHDRALIEPERLGMLMAKKQFNLDGYSYRRTV